MDDTKHGWHPIFYGWHPIPNGKRATEQGYPTPSQRNAFRIYVSHDDSVVKLNRNKKVVNGEKVKVTGNTLTRVAQNCCSRTVNRNKHANENEANYTMFFTRTILYAH